MIVDIDECFIWFNAKFSDIVSIKAHKGIDKINKSTKRRGLIWTARLNQKFHKKCRENHINEKYIIKTKAPIKDNDDRRRQSIPKSAKISSYQKFDYRTCCLFCTETICKRKLESVEILSHEKENHQCISFVESKTFDTNFRE